MAGKWMANAKKTVYYLKRNGVRNTWHAVLERLQEKKNVTPYTYEPVPENNLNIQREEISKIYETGEGQISFSILVPVYRTNPVFLREMIASVQNQTYPYWELILADATEDDSIEKLVDEFHPLKLSQGEERVISEVADRQIVYVHLAENKGISENTNEALRMASQPFTALLDHDDVLTPDALYEMAGKIAETMKKNGYPLEMVYSDEDKWSGENDYYDPALKEDFNLDYLLSNNYICHFLAMKTELIKGLGFRKAYDGAQDYDLVLRAAQKLLAEKDGEKKIGHVAKVLYHWRCHRGSTAENPQSKLYAYEAGKAALQDYADRGGIPAEAVHLKHLGFYRLDYKKPVFEARPDLGAVGGRIVEKGKIAGGRMDFAGKIYYKGLSQYFSGPGHRAVLTQDAEAVDIRKIKVAPACRTLFEQVIGVHYTEIPETGIFDARTLPKDADVPALSIKLGQALADAGYRILWDPEL